MSTATLTLVRRGSQSPSRKLLDRMEALWLHPGSSSRNVERSLWAVGWIRRALIPDFRSAPHAQPGSEVYSPFWISFACLAICWHQSLSTELTTKELGWKVTLFHLTANLSLINLLLHLNSCQQCSFFRNRYYSKSLSSAGEVGSRSYSSPIW
jgi:hypothetical protein